VTFATIHAFAIMFVMELSLDELIPVIGALAAGSGHWFRQSNPAIAAERRIILAVLISYFYHSFYLLL